MVTLTLKNKEVDITLWHEKGQGGNHSITIEGTGDFKHHLVEGAFELLDKFARQEYISHQSKEWTKRKL